MRKILLLLFSISMLAIIYSCNKTEVSLKLKNNSKYAITFDSALDTIPDSVSIDVQILIRDQILPNTTVTMIKPGDSEGWLSLIQNSTNNKLNVFIMNIDTLKRYESWKYIRKNKLYKHYEYTEEELNKKGWVIEYP